MLDQRFFDSTKLSVWLIVHKPIEKIYQDDQSLILIFVKMLDSDRLCDHLNSTVTLYIIKYWLLYGMDNVRSNWQ